MQKISRLSDDKNKFQDINKHKYFNSNSIWINLRSLKDLLLRKKNILPLPLIRNAKTLDPKNPDSEPVYQLETAMGTAINLFDNHAAIEIPKSRFIPVKNTADLLKIMSDAYQLDENFNLSATTDNDLTITLDQDYYKNYEDFIERFKDIPSLKNCTYLEVKGDVNFGENLRLTGKIIISNNESHQNPIYNLNLTNANIKIKGNSKIYIRHIYD